MCKVPRHSHDVTELKQKLTSKALRSVKAAGLLHTHQRSPNIVPKTGNSTTLNLEHSTQKWRERVEATYMKVIFLDAGGHLHDGYLSRCHVIKIIKKAHGCQTHQQLSTILNLHLDLECGDRPQPGSESR